MSPRFNMFLIVLVIALVLIRMSVFTVDEREYAVKFRFSEIVKTDYEPGLHFKVPFVNNITKFEDRTQIFENQEEKFLTDEKKNLIVDYFVTWRIVDPAQYYRSTSGDEATARNRLSAIIKEGMKAAISRRTVQEVVSAERSELMDQMLIDARSRSPELGIEVVDVRVKKIDLSTEVSDSVYQRMQQERQRVASQLRAEGREEAERIMADADRQRTIIQSEAYRDAQRIEGDGDRESAAIYATAYNQNRDFYSLYRNLTALRNTIGGDGDVLVLEPDSEFFRFLQSQMGTMPQQAVAD